MLWVCVCDMVCCVCVCVMHVGTVTAVKQLSTTQHDCVFHSILNSRSIKTLHKHFLLAFLIKWGDLKNHHLTIYEPQQRKYSTPSTVHLSIMFC